jgi:hypothetical protein
MLDKSSNSSTWPQMQRATAYEMRIGNTRPSCKALAIIVPRSLKLRAEGNVEFKNCGANFEQLTGVEAQEAWVLKNNKAEKRDHFVLPRGGERLRDRSWKLAKILRPHR